MAAGFDLQPASTFRDFTQQLAIWNEKFVACAQYLIR